MGNIDSRLRRLEERGGSEACPECGLAAAERRPLAVIREEHPERSFEGDPHEVCSRCGQPLYTVIRLVYGDEWGGGLT